MKKVKKKLVKKSFTESSIFQLCDHIYYREEEDQKLSIVNTNVQEFYYQLDSWAAEIWKLIDGKCTVAQIEKKIANKSGLTKSAVKKHSEKLLQTLLKKDLIIQLK